MAMSLRTCIIVTGTNLVITFIIIYSQNGSTGLAGSNIRRDERPISASIQSFASVDFLKKISSGKMDPVGAELLQHLRDQWIFAPSKQPYNLSSPERKSWDQIGQTKLVDKILKQRRNGFYVDSGAYEGEEQSNTLFFEKFRDWQGLLVEPDPWSFEILIRKNRKAYIVNTCIALGRSPERVDFTYAGCLGGISDISQKIPKREEYMIKGRNLIQCFPIHSLLAAIGQTHVDYYSLDVEGAEIEILRSFPWKHITVDVWTIEFAVHGGGPGTREREAAMRDIFRQTGLYGEGQILGGQDIVFVRKDVL